jgi:O-antigen ligase
VTTAYQERRQADARQIQPRAFQILGTIVFSSLLGLVILAAIPYGTAEAWWKALLVCSVLALTIVWLIEGFFSGNWIGDGASLVLPMATLALFSFVQTLSFGHSGAQAGELSRATWIAISADPYQTRFFAAQLLALTLAGLFLFRYASTEGRWLTLINVVIGVAVASAVFGIIRQTTQHKLGFGLSLLPAHSGYAQFINKNHFALLMEMGLGLCLGMILGGARKREQALIYLAALLPVWTALVLSGSRGGLVAMLAQVTAAVLLFSAVGPKARSTEVISRVANIAGSWPLRLVLLVVLISGVVIGTLWMGGDQLATRLEESHRQLTADNTGSRQGVSRNEIWRVTLRMFAAHPIFGVGMGGYWAAVPQFHDASGTMRPQEAHNDYLELLASGGLFGLGIAIWFGMAALRRTRENLRSPNRFRRAACFGAAVGIVGVAVHGLVDFGLHMMVNALIFTTLLVIATSKPRWAEPAAKTS